MLSSLGVSAFVIATGCAGEDGQNSSQFRTWTDATGNYSVEAKFVDFRDGNVHLRRRDGKEIAVPLGRLSNDDQQFARSLLAAGRLAKRPERALPAAQEPVTSSTKAWARFRGHDGAGVSGETGLPLTWSATENIAWKLDLPGPGSSSPIVWGDRIYLTCLTGYGLDAENPSDDTSTLVRHLLCIERQAGKPLWKRDVPATGRVVHFSGHRIQHGYASNTPVADETGVYVFFGTGGAMAFGHDGRERWRTNLGDGVHEYGSAASPILYDDLVIIHADLESQAIFALDKNSGREVWRTDTGPSRDSFSTPLVVSGPGGDELVIHHSQANRINAPASIVVALDPTNGQELWRCNTLHNSLIPSPIVAGGLIYLMNEGVTAAIRPGGRGNVTDSHLVWEQRSIGARISTPVYHDSHLYWLDSRSIACCADATTGQLVYKQRLNPSPGIVYSSGVLADGRLHYVSRENGTFVVAAQPQFRQLAHNVIEGDSTFFNATPAVVDGKIFLRSRKALYCIGN